MECDFDFHDLLYRLVSKVVRNEDDSTVDCNCLLASLNVTLNNQRAMWIIAVTCVVLYIVKRKPNLLKFM